MRLNRLSLNNQKKIDIRKQGIEEIYSLFFFDQFYPALTNTSPKPTE